MTPAERPDLTREDLQSELDTRTRERDEARAELARCNALVLERAALVCEAQAEAFLSPKYATDQPLSSFRERFACGQCAAAIRSAIKDHPND